jgi:hypothetical protein
MKGYVDGQDSAITTAWTSNAGIQSGQITTANTNMKGYVDAGNTIVSTAITTANTNMKGYVDAGNTIVSTAITTANTNMKGYVDAGNTIVSTAITTANTNMKGYVDAANTIQSNQITAIQGNVTTLQGNSYGNANVAAYLPTYSGNLTAGNITATTKFYGNVNGTATQLATAATAIGTFLAGKLSAATGSIPKNSVATVTYTITGLTTNHKIIISSGTVMPDRLFNVTAAWASATNTVSIQYVNNTGGAISVTLDINYFAFV